MSPPPETATSASPTSRSDLRWLLLFFGGMVLAGVACWHAYPLAATAYRGWRIHRHLSTAQEHMSGQKWAAAAAALREARKLAPEDPDVLHASLHFLQRAGRDPRGAVAIVRQLEKTGAATPADLVILGKMLLVLGEMEDAQRAYDSLAPADRQVRAAQELQADLLQAQGQTARARELRREILQAYTENPADLRQLALLEMNEGTAESRTAMRERLWRLARAEGPTRLTAVELLTRDKHLTHAQAEELGRIVAALAATAPDQNQEREAVRLRVISARLRLSPQSRHEEIDREITRWKDVPPAETRPLVAWLADEGEHARILRLVPATLAAKFTDILPLYVEALRQTGRWQELDAFLTSGGIEPAFSKTQKLLWQAEARAKVDADPARARQMVERLIEEGVRGDDLPLTLKTGELAERLSFWDLARRCFAACAARHSAVRPAMLVKVYEMADHNHDGAAMLDACAQLVEARPDNQSLLEQKLYLQVLLGIDLETAERQVGGLKSSAPARAGQRHLITALLAYRQGRSQEVGQALSQIPDPAALSAGERAVYAGLLKSIGGDPAKVFRILEKISPALLLEEEKRFAKRAL